MQDSGTAGPAKVQAEADLSYGTDPRQKLDVYHATSLAAERPIVVFFYGGAWRTGDKREYAFVAQSLAAQGMLVVIPNYRLYPQVTFPGFIQDGAAAVAWTEQHALQLGGNPKKIFLMGYSGGAYIAAMLGLNPKYLGAAGVNRDSLAGIIGIAGLYDFLPLTNMDLKPIFQDYPDLPSTQPMNYVDRHNPPMLLVAGQADDTIEPRNTIALADRIQASGGPVKSIIYPGVGHIGIMLPFTALFHNQATIVHDVVSFIVNSSMQ